MKSSTEMAVARRIARRVPQSTGWLSAGGEHGGRTGLAGQCKADQRRYTPAGPNRPCSKIRSLSSSQGTYR